MKWLWLDRGLVSGKLALSADDRGLTLGDGLFETLAVRNGVALWRFEHIERLRAGAGELGISFPEEAIENAMDALTHKARGSHVLRLMLTRGEGQRGLADEGRKPTLIGSLMPFDAGLRFQPITLVTSPIRRNLHSPSSHLKTLSYVDNVLAAREAKARHADDALMLNTAGRVACASIGNMFLEKDGMLLTPSLSEGILPGIMRAAVISVAKSIGIVVREKKILPRDVMAADAVFMTNSLRLLRPVTRCDDKTFTARSHILEAIRRGVLEMEQQQLALE
jgi:branched-chain amino acid aminotransferase